jgi:ubiquinone/menaquinone biosynthesis C-methylase UbiE
MSQEQYIIQGGRSGKERLSVLARALQPTTLHLFERVGLQAGMHCLDVGCGGGDVTLEMAHLVGSEGRVCGFDFDADILNLARRDAEEAQLHHVEYWVDDALKHQTEPVYDVVYARFLLTHLPDPVQGLAGMIRAAKPGGTVIAEDIDFQGHFCYPPNQAFDRYVEFYVQTGQRRGADPYIGMKLAGMFLNAGLEDVQVNLVQPVHLTGEGKTISKITLERIGNAIVSNGLATQAEVDQTVAELDAFTARPDTLISLPRIFQVWGKRAR